MAVVLNGSGLALPDLVRVARDGEEVALAPETVERMRETRALVEGVQAREDAVYGLTTGVGVRKRLRVPPDEAPAFNRALIENHLVGTGPDAPEDVVRATMLRVANGFALGTGGVRPLLAERLVAALNAREHPRVRMLGSVGQSDLAPLADLAHGLFADVELQAKEGLALVNSNAFSCGLAALAVADAERLLDALDVAGALDLEAFAANLTILHPAVGRVRPFAGLRFSLARLRDAARRQLPLGARRRPEPAGSAHLPLPAADPRRRP